MITVKSVNGNGIVFVLKHVAYIENVKSDSYFFVHVGKDDDAVAVPDEYYHSFLDALKVNTLVVGKGEIG